MYSVTTTVLGIICAVYMRGWSQLRSARAGNIQPWHAASFVFGLSAIWMALASRIAAYDHHLLTVHMIQHLLLMSVAAPLILLGQPLLVLANGLPSRLVDTVRPLFRARQVQQLGAAVVTPVWCWIAATAALAVWHLPAMLTLTLQSHGWHAFATTTFIVSGLLFWWPVIEPWPSVPAPRWSMVVYLFLAMLPCDILSAFLVFSERIAYAAYLSMPGHTGLSVLDDQQIAGALMWTVVTLIYLTAGTMTATRLLSLRVVEAV